MGDLYWWITPERFIVWTIWCVGFMAVTEYIVHKYLMHKPLLDYIAKAIGFNEKLTGWIFHDHAVKHHGGDNTTNIDLPLWIHLIFGWPLIVFIGWWDAFGAIILFATFAAHSYFWTKLHRMFHNLEQNWLIYCPFYMAYEAHHLVHHSNPTKNFGTVFPITDYIFRTKQ